VERSEQRGIVPFQPKVGFLQISLMGLGLGSKFNPKKLTLVVDLVSVVRCWLGCITGKKTYIARPRVSAVLFVWAVHPIDFLES